MELKKINSFFQKKSWTTFFILQLYYKISMAIWLITLFLNFNTFYKSKETIDSLFISNITPVQFYTNKKSFPP